MKKNFRVVIVFGIALSFSACTKKQTIEVDNETQSSVDYSIVDQEFVSLIPMIQGQADHTRNIGDNSLYNACDTLTLLNGDTSFGSSGHVDPLYAMSVAPACGLTLPDGRIREGKVLVRFTGKASVVNTQMIIKLQNYKADGISYTCDSIIANVISSGQNSRELHVKLINGICQSSTYTIKYNFDRTFDNTIYNSITNNESYTSFYGTSSGINRSGLAFSVNVSSSSPLIKYTNCKFIGKGILDLTPNGFKTRTLDFGNGNCDDDATFSVNGNTLAFKLK